MIRLLLVALVALGAAPQNAPRAVPPDPCPCEKPAPACQAFWNADVVFSGTVLSIENVLPPITRRATVGRDAPPPPPPSPIRPLYTKVSIRVDQTWRGGAAGDIDVFTGAPTVDCGVQFEEGARYVVYARRTAGQLQTSACSRTVRIDDARDDLDYFEELKRPASGGRIYGEALVNDVPAANLRVRIANDDGEWAAYTDANGLFEFPNRQPGKYMIGLDLPETYRLKFAHGAVALRDVRACAFARFEAVADGRVSLHVLDAQGRPAVRTTLELIEADSLRSARPRAVAEGSNAQGSVTWPRVPPGRYVIGLNVTRVSDPRRPQPILYYPGVSDVASAHIFEVGLGERVDLDTLRMPAPPVKQPVTGTVVRADGSPLRGADVVLQSAFPFTRGQVVGRSVKTDAQGQFSVPAVRGHRYVVQVLLGVEGEAREFFAESQPFELTEKTRPLTLRPKTK